MYKWDKNMVKSLLEGLITTDGCITNQNTVSLQMSNVKFMRELYYLLRNNNIDVSYGNIKMQKNATKEHVCISIPAENINYNNIYKTYKDDRIFNKKSSQCKNQYSLIEVDGFKFLPVRSKVEVIENLP